MKKPICKILRTNKNNNFNFTIKLRVTLDRSYIGYPGFLGIEFFKKCIDERRYFFLPQQTTF